MKFSNQLGDFLNALKQSLFTTTVTHKRHLTKPEVQFSGENMHPGFEFSNAGGIRVDKGRMRQAAATAAKAGSKAGFAGARCGAQNQIVGAIANLNHPVARVIDDARNGAAMA